MVADATYGDFIRGRRWAMSTPQARIPGPEPDTATISRQAAPGQAATLSQAQREDFEDAKPGPIEQGEQGPVADPGRLAGRFILTGTATG